MLTMLELFTQQYTTFANIDGKYGVFCFEYMFRLLSK